MVVVYGGHGERGPEGRVVTFVRPFVAAMPIFDEAMAHKVVAAYGMKMDEA